MNMTAARCTETPNPLALAIVERDEYSNAESIASEAPLGKPVRAHDLRTAIADALRLKPDGRQRTESSPLHDSA